MAIQAVHHFQLQLPVISRFPSSCRLHNGPATFKPQPLTPIFRPIGTSPRMPVASVVEESQESPEPEAEEEQQQPVAQSELKKERKDKEGDNFWGGVAQEITEIEWPAFGKVLGTTGVVLAVILGSSVVLLTVNAVLAELSDRVFAGKGVQDFFT